jgi:hypothetical protein
MRRERYLHLAALAAALTLAAGTARPARAQGNLQAFAQAGGSVFVTWQAVPDPAVVGYNVYRYPVGMTADKATLVNSKPVTSTSLIDSGLTLGTPVIYFAKAVYKDAAGNMVESTQSGLSEVTPQNPTVLPAGSFLYNDVDTINPGTVTVAGNILTIRASGVPLWDKDDGQTFLAMPVTGDYQITAQIPVHPENDAADSNPNGNAKVGLMIRESLFRGDVYSAVFSSAQRDPPVLNEGRVNMVGATNPFSFGSATGEADTPYPLYLRLLKKGSMVTAFESIDGGKTYTPVADPQNITGLGSRTYAGVFVEAETDGQYAIGEFDTTSIKIEPQ